MILIVEDEFMLAFSMGEMLEEGGFGPSATAAGVAKALAIVDGGEIRMAFVDLNLGRETSEAVVERLRRDGLPYTICTAYAVDQMPAYAGDAATLQKPVDEVQLLSAARAMSEGATR